MGLFSKKKDYSVYSKYTYKERPYSVSLFREFQNDFNETKYDSIGRRELDKCLLKSVIDEDFVDYLYDKFSGSLFMNQLVEAWKPEEIILEGNQFVAILKNKAIKPLLDGWGKDEAIENLKNLYNSYSSELITDECIDDSDSIIYDEQLYKYYKDPTDFKEIVDIYCSLHDDKENLNNVFYTNGELNTLAEINARYRNIS